MARTNYMPNSYGAINVASKWSDWIFSGTRVGTPTYSLAAGVYGSTAQRIQYTSPTETNKTLYAKRSTAPGSFAAGETGVLSFYAKGALVGCTLTCYLYAYNASNTALGTLVGGTLITLTDGFERYSLVYASLPATTSYLEAYIYIAALHTGDTADITYDAVQVEKLSLTPYIPTTTSAVTVRQPAARLMMINAV